MTEAILLIAHGSRRQAANDDLVKVANQLATERPDQIIRYSYLELALPSIPDGAEQCVQDGAQRVFMMPYFLSPGRHVVEDLEEFRLQFVEKFPQVEFIICPHLGLHPLMNQIILDRIAEAEQQQALQ